MLTNNNVKAVLGNNKMLISSVSFAAPIQTIEFVPEIVNLIRNIPSANDGEQLKDDNNITNYLEANKHRLLNSTEKNYENLVEALINDSIFRSATSSNPTLSLPSYNLYSQTHIIKVTRA